MFTDRLMRVLPAALLLAVALFLSSCARQAGRLLLFDETAALDRSRIEAAAAPLIARGATVAIMVVERGDDQGADFARRLEAAQLLNGSAVIDDVVALYVSRDPRYSELRAGGRWSSALPSETLWAIRQDTLNPMLRADSFTDGVATTLAAIDTRLVADASLLGWLGAIVRWVIYALIAAVMLFVFSEPIKDLLEWLKDLWLASPPGRLASWLWEQTPPGRRRALRRRTARIADMLRFTKSRSDAAHGYISAVVVTSDHRKRLRATLDALDKRRRELARRKTIDAALVRDLEQLYKDYGPLLDECHKYMPKGQSSTSTQTFSSTASYSSSDSRAGSSSSASDLPSISFDSGSSGGESRDGGSW